MSENLKDDVGKICHNYSNDKHRLMDIIREVQNKFGWISREAIEFIAQNVSCKPAKVEGVVSFYAFFNRQRKGKIVIRLCNGVSCNMSEGENVAEAFKKALGINFGQITPDGKISLEQTSCMGMCDQGPAALINNVVVTCISMDAVKDIVNALQKTNDPEKLIKSLGSGKNASSLIHSMVEDNIRKTGSVIFADINRGVALLKALSMTPDEVIQHVRTSRLRGRGGAGFPTVLKWNFAREAKGDRRFVLCNADEGEPGTFKDRVILTECPDMVFEGMAIAGYAIGSEEGILYLRGEYTYLKKYLENVLKEFRGADLLGKNIQGKGFNFDIRIQMGAGAYICGEETALINSSEGARGEPRNRPPFPAQDGYLHFPTIINNVETLCCVTRILEKGGEWFEQIGSKESSGTKLFSVSGDCKRPGVYELPYGITIASLLSELGGEDAIAVQVGGPSGQCINREDFGRVIGYEDLATGGSIIIFGPGRNMLDVASEFMEFFIEESCGCCTPCRVGNVLIKRQLDKIRGGKGESHDLQYLEELCQMIKVASRCGMGQTSPNPVLSTMKNFRHLYEKSVVKSEERGAGR